MGVPLTLARMQHAGFPAGAEPLVALDLADTLATVPDPPVDLLADPAQEARWWELQAGRLPSGPQAPLVATRRLRAAVRDLLDSLLEGRQPKDSSVDDLTSVAASAPTSARLRSDAGGLIGEERWHTEQGGNAALAFIAREAIELATDPERLATLRRCANPACSMLFLATNSRRIWCSPNVCGNRPRVARHHERSRQPLSDP
jgi:predicted RNA-binding Zn ribbon-like protein